MRTDEAASSRVARPVEVATTPVETSRAVPGCDYQAGTDPTLILVSRHILPDGAPQDGAVVVRDGAIDAVGTDADALKKERKYANASVLTCARSLISPGFINAHEHVNYSYEYPSEKLKPIYEHRDQWRPEGVLPGDKIAEPKRMTDSATLAWVEVRHLMSGVTTLSSSGHAPGLVKNVDRVAADAMSFTADVNTFPFGQAAEEFAGVTCPAPEALPSPKLSSGVSTSTLLVPHVGEGTNCLAELEIEAYLRYVRAHPGRTYSVVHGVAATSEQQTEMAQAKVGLVWSPRSNLALYGATIDPTNLLDQGGDVAIGTDWSPSGSYTMFEEFRCARAYAQARARRPITGRELWTMATGGAARVLGIDQVTGAIERGKRADLVILRDESDDGVDDVDRLTSNDVIAVLVDGTIRAVDRRHVRGDPVPGCSAFVGEKALCADAAMLGMTIAELLDQTRGYVQPLETVRQAPCEF